MAELAQFLPSVKEVLNEARDRYLASRIYSSQGTKSLDGIRAVLADLQNLRNSIVHSIPSIEPVKPAYSLEDDDHG